MRCVPGNPCAAVRDRDPRGRCSGPEGAHTVTYAGVEVYLSSAQATVRATDSSPKGPAHDRSPLSTRCTAYCSLNEGLGKVLRYGAFGAEVIDRLIWMSDVLGPALQKAVRAAKSVDCSAILAQMLQMGDEGHNRNRAGTLMLLRDLLPHLVASGVPAVDLAEVCRFVGGNDHFFLNLVMPTAKLAMDAGSDMPGSSLVVAMARDGSLELLPQA